MPTELLHPHEPINKQHAEFSVAETEQCFRQWNHLTVVRQARLAFLIAISLIALFMLSDYFILPNRVDLLQSIIIRSLIFIGGLIAVIIISNTHSTQRFDHTLLVYQAITITLLLLVFNFLKPDVSTAILSMVTITLGMPSPC
jgi:hypothetical protein